MLNKASNEHQDGFTLVEVLLSIVILALAASVISALYTSGLQALATQDTRVLMDSALASQMELLLSMKFSQLAGGTGTATINGQDYAITWDVVNIDLDGDMAPEPAAKQITVTLDDRSLTTIVADAAGAVGKL